MVDKLIIKFLKLTATRPTDYRPLLFAFLHIRFSFAIYVTGKFAQEIIKCMCSFAV